MKVQQWRKSLDKAAKQRLTHYTTTLRHNYRSIEMRNSERQSNRIERLEVAK